MKKDHKDVNVLVVARDITERKRTEEALWESESRYKDLVEKMTDVIYTLDSEGKITSANEAVKTMLGFEPGEIIGRNFAEIIPKDELPHAMAAFKQILSGKKITTETILIDRDKKPHNVEFSSTSVIKDGIVTGTRGIIRDITELKQAKVTIEQLRELDKMKDEFLNIAAHELRTPLTSIIGLSEIIKEQKPSSASSSQKYIDIINAEGIKISHIIKRMLTVTRFESGRETVYLEQFNLPAFVSSSLPNLNIIAKEKKSRIVFETEKKSVVIRSDKEKISQVIYNFIDNAVKYGPETQTIILAITKPEKRWIKIAVTDQGPGIASELQKKLFAKFSQLEPFLTRSQGGTGLGLYICKLIVDMLGGKIGVESELDKGSTFYFILPINKPSESPRKNKITSF